MDNITQHPDPSVVKSFDSPLGTLKDPDTVLEVGRKFLTQAKNIGVQREQITNLLNDAYGGNASAR